MMRRCCRTNKVLLRCCPVYLYPQSRWSSIKRPQATGFRVHPA
uniref:Uncharacterized protein n=1 Tax=Rhizophora mucronata TaxID=61149 RepID=A0A2P2NGD4_RHIMU